MFGYEQNWLPDEILTDGGEDNDEQNVPPCECSMQSLQEKLLCNQSVLMTADHNLF